MMMHNQTLRIVETGTNDEATQPAPHPVADLPTYYEHAREVDLRDYGGYSFPRFIDAVLDELERDFDHGTGRLVDEIEASDDVDFGILLAFPDESLVFVGSDPTAKDSIPWFAFAIEPAEPIPAPTSAQEALDLLKPPRVQDYIHDEGWLPNRHGEWWLLPCQLVPAGTIFQPGVNHKPFGPSPLGNHVPREYAFTVSDAEFMRRFREASIGAPSSIETPPEVIDWTWKQLQKLNPPASTPGWADIRQFAGDVLVRGTVRHRDDDHFVENLGDRWHLADTHEVEVYTGDEIATRVHLDYHGL